MDINVASLQTSTPQEAQYSARDSAVSHSDAPQLAIRTTESNDNTHFSQHTARTSDSYTPSNPIQHVAEEGHRHVGAAFEAGIGILTDTVV